MRHTVALTWSLTLLFGASGAVALSPAGAAPSAADGAFGWTLVCDGDLIGASVAWQWLQDGQVMSGEGGLASCYSTANSDASASGGGVRPANATGFTAELTQASDTASVTKTFSVGKAFGAQLQTAVNEDFVIKNHSGNCKIIPCGVTHITIKAGAQFSFSANASS